MQHLRESMRKVEHEAITILVTPVWKDAARLEDFGPELAAELVRRDLAIEWVIADDGSSPDEVERLQELQGSFAGVYPRVRLHAAEAHRGKGSVVREAWALEPEAAWLAFVDADGSVSANDFVDLIEQAWDSGNSTIAIRKATDGSHVQVGLWGWLRHHGFLVICRWLLGVKSSDTQCGAKVMKGADYLRVVARLQEPGLAFDSEMLAELKMAGLSWHEVPVNWRRQAGSRVSPWRDGIAMLKALFRIRKRLRARS